jgi:hypothetical protein
MITQALLEVAESFFGNIQNSPDGQSELSKYDRQIQFELTDDESFFVDIKKGKLSINKGKTEIRPDQGPIYFITDRDTLFRLFRGKMRYTEAYEYAPRPPDGKGKLFIKGTPGVKGGSGGILTIWVGTLIRMGQELR